MQSFNLNSMLGLQQIHPSLLQVLLSGRAFQRTTSEATILKLHKMRIIFYEKRMQKY